MKRRKTQLELNLIEKGWELDHKTYTGKHSDKVLNYVYEKVYSREFEREDGKIEITTWSARVLLDSKREHVVDVLVRSPLPNYIDEITASIIICKLGVIKQEVQSCYPKKEEQEESPTESFGATNE